jgi:hypothetical protein
VSGARGARALLAVALLAALGDGFLLWGRTLATPVGAAAARARFLPGPAGPGPGPRPPAGLYRYRTDGSETVDRFGIERTYPRETVRVVTDLGGCRWRETVPLLAQHTETYDFCSDPALGDARDVAYATSLTYFLVPGVQRFACAVPGRRLLTGSRPGTVVAWRCTQGASTSENTTSYLGGEPALAGSPLAGARHLRVVTALRGQSTGAAVRDLWLDPQGLVLREERLVRLVVRSGFVGRLVYQERATFQLTSREPVPPR